MKDFELLELWYRALHEPVGIVVEVNDVQGFIQRMYAQRKQSADDQLMSISLVQSPSTQGQVWILKKQPEVEDAPHS